ncbi:MAG: peptidase [Bacteroidota bacterium]|nr:peptidase [Bacteroidota bacterium]
MKKIFLLFFVLATGLAIHAQPDTSHVQVTTFNVNDATEHWLNTLSGAARAKSDAYFEGGYWLILWNTLYAVFVGAIFLLGGLSKRMKAIVDRVKNVNIQNLLYALLYFILSWILLFPLSIYQGYYREHQYNLSNLTLGGWFKEEMIGLSVGVILGSILLTLVYFAMRKAGNKWWMWAAGICIVFITFIVFVAPVFLSPMFNDYKPLAEGPLKQQILSMARANSIPAENVYQFDASKQSDRVSANVSGFGSTTRISLNDNLLKRCTPAEIRSVMGHEMGHYVMNHVYKGLFEMSVLLVVLFAFINFVFNLITRRYGDRLGVKEISDIGSLPLLAVLFSLASFVFTPVTNTMTRTQETEADMFGLNAAREPDAEAHVDMMLSEYRKIDPGYWEEIFFYDHPSGRNRVHMAMQWKAEHLNEIK